MAFFLNLSFAAVIVLVCIVKSSEQYSIQEFVTLTQEQKRKFDEFRDKVSSRLPHDYMRQDIYLIRWLRDSFFDVKVAEKRLFDNLLWREENNIDNILKEDWSDMDQEYKYTVEGCSREGFPIITVQAGDWDLRRAVVTGQTKRIRRYFERLFEESVTLLRIMGTMESNATQFITVLDLSNFNLVTQGCPRCIPLLMSLLSTYQNHYPGHAHKVLAINTPQFALPLWEIFRHLLDANVKAVFSFYGRNSKEWRRKLLEDIDENQLTKQFGGTRKNPAVLDMDDIRKNGLKFKCSEH